MDTEIEIKAIRCFAEFGLILKQSLFLVMELINKALIKKVNSNMKFTCA